jgi:hypothetical protein
MQLASIVHMLWYVKISAQTSLLITNVHMMLQYPP